MQSKLEKIDLIKKLIFFSIFTSIAYIFGYPDGGRLIVIGSFIMLFGFWYKWHYQWTINGSEYIIEAFELIEKKLKEKPEGLTSKELWRLSNKRIFSWIGLFHFKIGVAVVAIGIILLIIK
ncbi:hypothetical protein [Sulfuricurvum sp.]|uniref:hypothetical protein n=1 Tax=Sulfuricurvum sp. TaxID=2025608 RepID=UPI0035620C6A